MHTLLTRRSGWYSCKNQLSHSSMTWQFEVTKEPNMRKMFPSSFSTAPNMKESPLIARKLSHSPLIKMSETRSNSTSQRSKMRSENDFIFGKLIGQGSFSSVYLVKDTHNQQEYAAKVCQKTLIVKEKKTTHVMREKEIMNLLNLRENSTAPFFVKLAYSFQTEANLYFILSYCKNGEFLELIQHVGNFDHDSARFYTGEIVRGLEHLHSLNIVHRDLKPENILLDEKMHIKISDFGCAKIVEEPEEDAEAQPSGTLRSSSFVGTAQYVSPEVLHSKQVCLASDLWSLGCIIYQIVSGLPPFRSQSEYLIFKSILKLQYEYPQGFFDDAKDMVQKLLVHETMKRLGASDRGGRYDSLRQHPFLAPIDLDTLYATTPPTITTYTPDVGEDVWDSSLEPGLEERELELLHQMIISPRLPQAQQQSPPLQQQQSVNSNSSPTVSFTGSSSKKASPAHSRTSESGACRGRRNLADITMDEHERRLRLQERESEWHQYVEGNLILKQGFLYKRKGLFPRRRMFLLTTGPHLYYVDPDSHVLKGQVPYGPTLRPEGKTFKTFLVHTPNRTYYLEDPENASARWMTALEDVRDYYFPGGRDGGQ